MTPRIRQTGKSKFLLFGIPELPQILYPSGDSEGGHTKIYRVFDKSLCNRYQSA